MTFLENKIPPPAIALFFAIVIWSIAKLSAELTINHNFMLSLACCFFVLGIGFGIMGIVAFRRAHTTLNPMQPDTASSLVDAGVYKLSRNPMYVGIAMVLVAWCLLLGSLMSLLVLPGFILYITQYQIKPEERALIRRFGRPFADYQSKVRRWL